MAIVKNNSRVWRLEGEFSLGSRDSMSSDEDVPHRWSSESDEDYDNDDADSGAGSDDIDLSDLGIIGEELCKIGNRTCSIPFELYDLPDLSEILSVDVWNNCLSEEERYSLAEYLPDIDQETFMRTLKELFSCNNFHFGSPLVKLFDGLKGGLYDPRVALYQQGLNYFQKHRHYHLLRKYQNSMVGSLIQIRNAWENCMGYSIEEKLRVLNLRRSQRSLKYENMEDLGLETDSSGREDFGEGFWTKRLKEKTIGSKMGHRERAMTIESAKYEKQNPKGILKLAGPNVPPAKGLMSRFPYSYPGLETKSRPKASMSTVARQKPLVGYDLGDRNTVRGSTVAKAALLNPRKKHEALNNGNGFAADRSMGLSLPLKNDALHSQGKKRKVNEMTDVKMLAVKLDRNSFNYHFQDSKKKANHLDTLQDQVKDRAQHLLSKENLLNRFPGKPPFRHDRMQDEAFDDLGVGSNNWNVWQEFRTGKKKNSSDPKVKYSKSSPLQMNDTYSRSNHRFKTTQEKTIRKSSHNGDVEDTEEVRDMSMFTHSDETETESSEHEDKEYITPRSKVGYHRRGLEKDNEFVKKDKQEYGQALDRVIYSSEKVGDHGEQMHVPKGAYSFKGKQTGKVGDPCYMLKCATVVLEERNLSGCATLGDNSKNKTHKSVKNGLHETPRFVDDRRSNDRLGKKGQTSEAQVTDLLEKPNISLLGCNSVTKKQKVKVDETNMDGPDESDYLHSGPQKQVDDPASLKKFGKRKVEAKSGSLATMVTSESGLRDVDPETKPAKKPFTLITPTVHSGFSFSIIHLLSAVRVAMITPLTEDVSGVRKHLEKPNEVTQNGKHDIGKGEAHVHSHESVDVSISDRGGNKNLPSLIVQEIVNCVRSNPGDPCILETPEPLQDLVKGVLKIFSSKTAPLGAKGWKPLVFYEKSTKSWSWVGPVSSVSLDTDTVEEETSSEAWGLPHKMLVKLVDSFANWLKSGQETLQQLGSLPPPPLILMQRNLDEKERFRDLKAQKSLTTISPSCEEVRAYFRREEVLRYSVPDRTFSYTAVDGRKSIVAPLRRCGGKLTSKARDHFMLKPDRPPHVTILCLVRDAAARLPGSIGTRADVCTLIRDSQFIVEDVSDTQVNQVVSGALDRLHYERDPCVQFDGERKLWVYLHRGREEEDFEDDGTSSTKKWKRQRKDPAEQSDPGTVNDAYELSSDVKIEPSSTHAGERMELIYNHSSNGEPFVGSLRDSVHEGHPIGWKVLGLNSVQESGIPCQENPTNEEFDDGTFSSDQHDGPSFL